MPEMHRLVHLDVIWVFSVKNIYKNHVVALENFKHTELKISLEGY